VKTYWVSSSITSRIFNFCTRWKWVVGFTSRQLYVRGISPRYPWDRRLSGHQSRSGCIGEERNFHHFMLHMWTTLLMTRRILLVLLILKYSAPTLYIVSLHYFPILRNVPYPQIPLSQYERKLYEQKRKELKQNFYASNYYSPFSIPRLRVTLVFTPHFRHQEDP
jgi:hypothetical protein